MSLTNNTIPLDGELIPKGMDPISKYIKDVLHIDPKTLEIVHRLEGIAKEITLLQGHTSELLIVRDYINYTLLRPKTNNMDSKDFADLKNTDLTVRKPNEKVTQIETRSFKQKGFISEYFGIIWLYAPEHFIIQKIEWDKDITFDVVMGSHVLKTGCTGQFNVEDYIGSDSTTVIDIIKESNKKSRYIKCLCKIEDGWDHKVIFVNKQHQRIGLKYSYAENNKQVNIQISYPHIYHVRKNGPRIPIRKDFVI
jgi:hypothetical protein